MLNQFSDMHEQGNEERKKNRFLFSYIPKKKERENFLSVPNQNFLFVQNKSHLSFFSRRGVAAPHRAVESIPMSLAEILKFTRYYALPQCFILVFLPFSTVMSAFSFDSTEKSLVQLSDGPNNQT